MQLNGTRVKPQITNHRPHRGHSGIVNRAVAMSMTVAVAMASLTRSPHQRTRPMMQPWIVNYLLMGQWVLRVATLRSQIEITPSVNNTDWCLTYKGRRY